MSPQLRGLLWLIAGMMIAWLILVRQHPQSVSAAFIKPGGFDPRMVAPASPPGGPPEKPDYLEGVLDGRDLSRPQRPVRLTRVSEHLPVATDIQAVPGHDDTLAVLQKGGVALLLEPDAGTFRPWFSLEVNGGAEMGLIGLAFAPDFETSGAFYLHHNPISGDRSEITRFFVDPTSLDGLRRGPTILVLPQPYGNHNGGQLLFGRDGLLYAAFGDGGSAYDPEGNGQNGRTLSGSIVRIDPLPEGGYAIPPDNPFIGDEAVDDAIFAMGLRNPWRMAFAPDGRLVAADVGQSEREEVNVVTAGDNLGWSRAEGSLCMEPPCDAFTGPVWEYAHDDGISITGGVFVTAAGPAEIVGRYLIGDFGSGRLWALDIPHEPGARAKEPAALGRFPIYPSTFGLDGRGRAYVADFQGFIYRIDGSL
ncbi:MAG: glucose/arabinose dehydrogenase [Myxococcota bacterium]|jgi:glucose/arabinose dehydrogenase